MSNVLRHTSSRLASRVPRPALALALALGFLLPSAAGTNTLTYAATLGRIADRAVVRYPLTNDIELTVTLYGSEDADAKALWTHRLTTSVYDGDFVVEISDAVGMRDASCPSASYSRLDAMFEAQPLASAYWVEISNVTQDGVPLSEAATGALQRGKITGVPFAVLAARAESARGNFTVRGKATVSVLKTIGRMQVDGTAAFKSSASFYDPVAFGSDTVSVTGSLRKTTLDGIGELLSDTIVATERVTVRDLSVTNGADSVLTPKDGVFAAAKGVTVAGTLDCVGGMKVGGTLSATNTVSVEGDLVLDSAQVTWREGGTLSVPDGVYVAGYDTADAKIFKDHHSTGKLDFKNETGGNALATVSYGRMSDGRVQVGGSANWARVGGDAVNVSVLVPLKPGESAYSGNGAINAFMKEMSK